MGATNYRNCTNNIARKEIPKLLSFLLKLFSFYSLKDWNALIPKISISVFKCNCARCNSCFIGETCHHFQTRIDEHIGTDKNLSI